MSDKLHAFRESFSQVAQAHRCELAYLEQLYDSTVEKLFCDLLPKMRLLEPLTEDTFLGTYKKVIRDGYIPEYFVKGNLSEEVFVNEVSRVLRNHPLVWKGVNMNTKYIQDYTFNSYTLHQALKAAANTTLKVGSERSEVGPLCLPDSICEEMCSAREVVIRLTYIFLTGALGAPPEVYYHCNSVPLVTLLDDKRAKQIADFCKKKYDYDASFLFSKKMDKLFDGVFPPVSDEEEKDGKNALKKDPASKEAIDYTVNQLKHEFIAASCQFFKIIVIAFFVDVADGKPIKDAFEKLMVMMACIASMRG